MSLSTVPTAMLLSRPIMTLAKLRRGLHTRRRYGKLLAPPTPWLLLTFASVLLPAILVRAQTAQPSLRKHGPQITVNVREVVVDVAVTTGNGYLSRGEPIRGLKREDFEVFENGRQQAIQSFQDHQRSLDRDTKTAEPGDGFADPDRGLSVILIDQASLGFTLQPWLLTQLNQFLQNAPQQSQIALFAISPRLRLVHGFTSDHGELLRALQARGTGLHPMPSPFLEDQDQRDLAAQAPAALRALQLEHGGTAGALADQLERLQEGMTQTEAMERTNNTLAAFQQLARYLACFPGRKSLIWVSSTFSDRPFGLDTEPDPEYKVTTDMLQAARVAVFPLDATGLDAPNLPHAGAVRPGVTTGQQLTATLDNERREASLNRNRTQTTMDEIAHRTGGEAYYNTNGIAWAMDRIVTRNESYYTLTYSSSSPDSAPDYAHVRVQLKGNHGLYRLSYRPGYFAQEARALKQDSVESFALGPYMDPSMPAVNQIRFGMVGRPAPSAPEKTTGLVTVEDRPSPPGTHHYKFRVVVPLQAVQLASDPDGTQRADLLVGIAAYTERGALAGSVGNKFSPTLDPGSVQQDLRTGLQFTQELDLPPGRYMLRTGVYDLHSARAGTADTVLSVHP